MPSSVQVVPQTRSARVPRRPQHTFNLEVRPWQIVPYFIAPVLPGETMKNLLLQARVVTDPINNPLTGWWCEFYVWYVKHRDFNEPLRSQLVNMMIDPTTTVTTVGSANTDFWTFNGAVDFVKEAHTRVTETYFRDANESASLATIGNYYSAQISQMTFLDSALTDTQYVSGSPGLVVGGDDTVYGHELDQTWILWQQYRTANLTHMTYEEYLATYGIPLPAGGEGSRRPELVRFVRDWAYPSNTINPTDGTPSSAVSWAIAERADKDRFFREPGFLFGQVCVRPKVFLKNQGGTVSGALKDALAWLPAVMGDNPEYSIRKFTASTGPLPTVAVDYRIDLKDLFLYGEQLVNYATTATGKNIVALPITPMTTSGSKKYATATDADNLFKAPAVNKIRMDGIVSLNILGQQIETTPTASPGGF
jgi:hypothetical protein